MTLHSTDRVLSAGSLAEVTRLIREVVALPFGEQAEWVLMLAERRQQRPHDDEDYSRALRESLSNLILALRAMTPHPHQFGNASRDAAVARFTAAVQGRYPAATVERDPRVEVVVADTSEASSPIAVIVRLPSGLADSDRPTLRAHEFDVECETGEILLVSVAEPSGPPDDLPPNVW